MPPKAEDNVMNTSPMVVFNGALIVIAGAALFYRNFLYRRMGSRAIGLWNAGVSQVYFLACLAFAPPHNRQQLVLTLWAWRATQLALVVQFIASKIRAYERHSDDIGCSWVAEPEKREYHAGREAALALSLSVLLYLAVPGMGLALALGWLCSEAQIALCKLRLKREIQLINDSKRRAEQLQDLLED